MNQETEYIKIDRDTIINHLTWSMYDHYEMNLGDIEELLRGGFIGFENMSDDDLLAEYREYISEDPDYPVVIELEK